MFLTTACSCVAGDQVISCRRSEFKRVGGYNESLAIMEDADLCIRMHESGPTMMKQQANNLRYMVIIS